MRAVCNINALWAGCMAQTLLGHQSQVELSCSTLPRRSSARRFAPSAPILALQSQHAGEKADQKDAFWRQYWAEDLFSAQYWRCSHSMRVSKQIRKSSKR